jgi:hypothetical protein
MFYSYEVGRTVFFANAAFIIAKDNIHNPVEAVFNAPMPANRPRELGDISRKRRNKVAKFCRYIVTYFTNRLYTSYTFKPRPFIFLVQPFNIVCTVIFSCFYSSVIFIYIFIRVNILKNYTVKAPLRTSNDRSYGIAVIPFDL